MTRYLLDANVVIVLVVHEHEHHVLASEWFVREAESAYLCPIVEGALLRFLVRCGEAPAAASAVLEALRAHPKIEFTADSVSYLEIDLAALRGYRQLTDAYLVALAASQDLVLATLDRALVRAHPQAVLVET